MNLAEALEIHARARPLHPAVIAGDLTVTHGEFAERVRNAAAGLAALGVKRGDVIGLCLRDTTDHLVLLFAFARAGIVTLPIDWRWTVAEKQSVAKHFEAAVVFCEDDQQDIPDVAVRTMADLAAASHGEGEIVESPDGSLPLLLSLSSGTTGRPKGPRIDHRHMLRRFWTHWINFGLNSTDRYVSATPLYFGGGRTFSMSVLFSGGTVVLYPPPFDVADLPGEIACIDATSIFLVPAQLRKLLDLPDEATAPMKRLRLLLSSGAPLTGDERHEIGARLCENFVEYYASTEGGGVSYSDAVTQRRHPDSVGLPVFAVEVDVVDEDDKPLPAGAVGHLRYRGPGVADGFYREEATEKSAFRHGWFYPGDLAEINEEGYVFLRGRAKDMIIRGGVNIHPTEIEFVLQSHPNVAEAAVVGRASKIMGQEVAAYVVLSRNISDDDLVVWCRERLAPYKIPRDLIRLAELPRNSAGKVLKSELPPLPEDL
ncbi:class I adenylate-forming enzyme family protein [Hoeflea sp. CAU 1731]